MKSFKQLNEDISNIINPQPLDEAKRKSEMNICLNQWDSIVEMQADMIRGKTKR